MLLIISSTRLHLYRDGTSRNTQRAIMCNWIMYFMFVYVFWKLPRLILIKQSLLLPSIIKDLFYVMLMLLFWILKSQIIVWQNNYILCFAFVIKSRRAMLNWLMKGSKSSLPEPTALQTLRAKQIKQLTYFDSRWVLTHLYNNHRDSYVFTKR